MNPEQDSGSLADRAAAWVPPWERPADREAPADRKTPEDQAREDVGTEPDAPDDPAALDREIDADIVREAGLPGPGTVESDVDAEIDIDADADPGSAPAAVADTHIETDTDIDVEIDPDADHAAVVDTYVAADVETNAVSDLGTGGGVDADSETGADAESATGAGGGLENDVVSDSVDDAEPELAADVDTLLAAGPSPLPGLAGTELGAALEAILMVVDEPVTEAQLADVLDVAPEDVAERLRALAADYAESGRGFELRRAAGGWRFYTRAEFSGYVERFVLDGQSARLTQAALETLAVVAYQQPVTRSRISAIRGVNCDGVVRTLVTRGLLEESGTQPETGAYLYRTTTLFLEKLGLDSVDELPPLAPFLPDDVNGLTDAQR